VKPTLSRPRLSELAHPEGLARHACSDAVDPDGAGDDRPMYRLADSTPAPRHRGDNDSHSAPNRSLTLTSRPNILVVMTDQQRFPPPYESEDLKQHRREHMPSEARLRDNGISFQHHYPMAAACAPRRASLLTGHYPSLHGVTQTDGLAKTVFQSQKWLLRSVAVVARWTVELTRPAAALNA
jgi:hypothetical protein